MAKSEIGEPNDHAGPTKIQPFSVYRDSLRNWGTTTLINLESKHRHPVCGRVLPIALVHYVSG